MRKLIIVFCGLAAFVAFIASPVLAAAYTFNITITESSGNSYHNQAWIDSINNSSLVAQGYLSSTGLDVRVMDGSNALPTLVANDKTLFVTGLAAKQSKTLQLTTGNSPASSMPIIVGNYGYITTADGASLELGNNFSLDISGYFDTNAGQNKNIIYKQNAFRVYVSATGNIRAAILGTGDTETLAVNAAAASGDHDIIVAADGTNFSIKVDGTQADSASLVNSQVSVPDNSNAWIWDQNNVMPYINFITASISSGETKVAYDAANILDGHTPPDAGAFPFNTTTWTGTNTNVGIDLDQTPTGGYRWLGNFAYVQYDLTSYQGNTYICTSNIESTTPPDQDAAHWAEWYSWSYNGDQSGHQPVIDDESTSTFVNTTFHYGNGRTRILELDPLWGYSNGYNTAVGASGQGQWSDSVSYYVAPGDDSASLNLNIFFMCNSNYPDARSHSDFDASGTYWFQSYFGQWYYRVFSGHPLVGSLQTIALPQTVYIPDICVFYENTTGSPKTGNIAEVYSNGPAPLTEVLRYQPENIIQGTDLPDFDGHQDGVITWGNNPSGVTIANGSFQPTNPTQYGNTPGSSAYAPSNPGTIDLGNPIAPPQLYTELDTSKIPGAAAIDAILNAGQVPRALWWFPFIFLGIDIIGLLVYDATQRTGGQGSLLAMCITILILLIICGVSGDVGVSGMIPLWTAILFIIPAAALILSRRHVGWG